MNIVDWVRRNTSHNLHVGSAKIVIDRFFWLTTRYAAVFNTQMDRDSNSADGIKVFWLTRKSILIYTMLQEAHIDWLIHYFNGKERKDKRLVFHTNKDANGFAEAIINLDTAYRSGDEPTIQQNEDYYEISGRLQWLRGKREA